MYTFLNDSLNNSLSCLAILPCSIYGGLASTMSNPWCWKTSGKAVGHRKGLWKGASESRWAF